MLPRLIVKSNNNNVQGERTADLTIEQLVKALNKSGSQTASVETVKKDIAAGCPVNENGTIFYFKYLSWQCKQKKK